MGYVGGGESGRARLERLRQIYRDFTAVEEAFDDALEETLDPRPPSVLLDLVGALGLPEGSNVLDVGCGEGVQALQLAERFGFSVTGIEPVSGALLVAGTAARRSAEEALAPPLDPFAPPEDPPPGRLAFCQGFVEELPIRDGSFDLVWCRDMLVHVLDLGVAFAQMRRVLAPGGRIVVYTTLRTGRLETGEAARLFPPLGVVPDSTRAEVFEAAVSAAGLAVIGTVDLSSEWGEWNEEAAGLMGRKLLHAARLTRRPALYRARFGDANYDIALADCLWHVYSMVGKLTRKAYLLAPV